MSRRFRVGQRVVLRHTIRRAGIGTQRWGLVWKGSEGVVRARRRKLWGGNAYEVELVGRGKRARGGVPSRRSPKYNGRNVVPDIPHKTLRAAPSRLPIIVFGVLMLIVFIAAITH